MMINDWGVKIKSQDNYRCRRLPLRIIVVWVLFSFFVIERKVY